MAQSSTAAVSDGRVVAAQEKYVRLYNDGTMLILNARLAYPHVFKPYKGRGANANQTPKYGLVGLWPKAETDHLPSIRLMAGHIKKMCNENKVDDIAPNNKFLRNGDQSGKADYKGHYTISASETRPPVVRSNRRDPKTKRPVVLIPDRDEQVIYGGCWANFMIRPWWMNNEFGKKVNAGLLAVQFLRDDDAFGQGRIAEADVDEAFDEFADDTDSGFDDSLGDDFDL